MQPAGQPSRLPLPGHMLWLHNTWRSAGCSTQVDVQHCAALSQSRLVPAHTPCTRTSTLAHARTLLLLRHLLHHLHTHKRCHSKTCCSTCRHTGVCPIAAKAAAAANCHLLCTHLDVLLPTAAAATTACSHMHEDNLVRPVAAKELQANGHGRCPGCSTPAVNV